MPKLKYKNNNEWTEINIVGEKGQNGLSAYEVAVKNGFVGTESQWLESLKGASGEDGKNGTDGYSPIANVTKSGKTATITITDRRGTTTATISDGQDGEDWIPTAAEKSAIAAEAARLIDISGKADKADTYTKAEVDSKVATVYRYKGSVSSIQNLPDTGLTIGDVYNVESDDNNFAWTGTEWDKLGGTVDLSGYQLKIDSLNKLSSDLIDDTDKTNKFVTDTEKARWDAKYNKPSAGIPKTDLAAAVQTSLSKADTALQSYTEQYTGTISGIIMNGENKGTSGTVNLGTVITAHQDISSKADKSAVYTKTEIDTKLAEKADKSTTLAGYGITDGETTSHKVTLIHSSNTDAQYPSALAVYTAVNQRELKNNKVTAIGSNPTDTQYPSALAVKKAIDAANPYVFVNEIPQDADHSKKYVLPDGYIWEWQEGTPSVPYNANTGIINKRPPTNQNYETALLNQSGTLVSELIPFDASWKYSSDGSYGHLADIQISGISKIVPAYNSSVIIYYYRRDNGNSLGAALSQQMYTLNYTPNTNDITLPVQFSLMDQNVSFAAGQGVDISNPGATIGYVRVMIGISTAGDITENDVKDVVINVPFYDTPGIPDGWANTGQKHSDYILDSVFDVKTNQKLYVVGDSIAYGYGGSGIRLDSWVKYAIEHNGYDAENSLNLSESGLGFCTTSTKSHTITDIVGGTDFAGADVVVVALGINDWKSSATLAQFWTGMEYCFNKIRTDNPYCKIYYLLPFNISYSGAYASFYGLGFKGDSDASKCYGHTLREFINLIKAKLSEPTFKAFDIHVIDMVECAAINRNNITTALFDNLHPSAATQEVLGKEIARFIAQDRSVKDNSNYLTLDTLPIYNGGVQ